MSVLGKLLKFVNPVIPVEHTLKGIPRYVDFWSDYKNYKKLLNSGEKNNLTILASIHEKNENHEFDAHYQFQPLWALKNVMELNPAKHVDVGSQLNFGLTLSLNIPVDFVDLRKLNIQWPNYSMIAGSILSLPYPDNSVSSLSCLHVIEHIGLGRYGDPLNPNGSKDAAKELTRIIKPEGHLLLSTPIGKSKTAFNSHRIHTTLEIIKMFSGLQLIDFSVVSDEGTFKEHVSPSDYDNSNYACGMFHFKK